MITADYLYKSVLGRSKKTAWPYIQGFIILLLWLLGFFLIIKIFPTTNLWVWVFELIFLGLSFYFLFNRNKNLFARIIISSLISIAGINYIINLHVYPFLFDNYQSEALAAKYINSLSSEERKKFYLYKEYSPSLDFYNYRIVEGISKNLFLSLSIDHCYIFTNENGKNEIEKWGLNTSIIKTYRHFHISTLSTEFLNPSTRAYQTEKRYLIKVVKIK